MSVTRLHWWWFNIGSHDGLRVVRQNANAGWDLCRHMAFLDHTGLRELSLDIKYHNISGCINQVTYIHIFSRPVISWWRHQMETFSALLAICARNSPVPGEFPTQRPVTRSFAVFFDLRLNKRLSKQSWGWWFETLSRPLWRHRNVQITHWCPQADALNLDFEYP